jgi:soluble lytic murein transglycosylase-like protein
VVLLLEQSTIASEKDRNPKPISEEVLIEMAPPNLQVNHWIQIYCAKYEVPEKLVRRCLYQETRYAGVLDFSYNPFEDNMVSSAKARGPMQVLNICARDVWGKEISTWTDHQLADSLRYNIEFNVKTGIKHISKLYKQYNNWATVFSVYNQGNAGKYSINNYAKKITRR